MSVHFDPNELLEWKDELLLSISQSNSSCIAIFKNDGSLVFANEAMQSLFVGNPSESFINPTFDKITSLPSSNGNPLFSGYITIGSRNDVSTSIVAQIYKKDERILIVGGVNAKNLLEQNEAMLLLNRQVNNLQRQLIKEKHELEITLKRFNEANEQLKILNATKDKFFSIIAHDLRNPFGAVLALSSMLAQKINVYPLERVEAFANNLHLASKQAYNLLENLLEWSRIQTGKISPSPKTFDINDAIEVVLELSKPMADEKKISLMANRGQSISVFADKEMVNAILRNLTTNAIKFTNPNGTVTISVETNNQNLICSVSDTGIGMEKNLLESLFRIESMATEVGTSNEKGTGLGLILCKEFVEMNAGEIWAESAVGKGSTFKFSLPLG